MIKYPYYHIIAHSSIVHVRTHKYALLHHYLYSHVHSHIKVHTDILYDVNALNRVLVYSSGLWDILWTRDFSHFEEHVEVLLSILCYRVPQRVPIFWKQMPLIVVTQKLSYFSALLLSLHLWIWCALLIRLNDISLSSFVLIIVLL